MAYRVEGIDHVEVLVRDLERAARWYAAVLGLEETRRWDPEPVMIGAGGSNLALFSAAPGSAPGSEEEKGRRPRWRRVAWRTDAAGFEAAQKHLDGLQIPFHGPVDHGAARSIYFADPDGNPLEITYYPS